MRQRRQIAGVTAVLAGLLWAGTWCRAGTKGPGRHSSPGLAAAAQTAAIPGCRALDEWRIDEAQSAYLEAAELASDGRQERALAALREAYALGYDRFKRPLREDPGFASLPDQAALSRVVHDAARSRRQALAAAAEQDPSRAGACLAEAARVAADVGDLDGALVLLEQGLALGYRDFRQLEDGAALESLRSHERFARIVDEAFRQTYAWTGTDQQKIDGLMQVYAEVEHNFAFFDRCPDLDWHAEVVATIPRVLAARSLESYYLVLAELVARLGDGHTGIGYPRAMTARLASAPVDVEPVEGRLVVTRVEQTPEADRSGVAPGDALVEVDGMAADEALELRVLRYQGFSTRHAARAYGASQLLVGPAGDRVELELERPDGRRYLTALAYSSTGVSKGHSESSSGAPVSAAEVAPGVYWVELRTFDDPRVASAFAERLGDLDLAGARGLILDLRRNAGGDTPVGMQVISHLIREPLATSAWRTPMHIAAHHAWGRAPVWFHGRSQSVNPAAGPLYLGPLVVLTSAYTYSAAEDFCVPLKHSGRATLIGERTGGSTGQPLKVYLPGGGSLRVCSKRDTFPDGTELVGVGIEPDIEVVRTIDDVVNGRDPVLERAIEHLEARPAPDAGRAGSSSPSG